VISAIDIFTGNFDRLVSKFNPENFKIDFSKPTITLIDNIDDRSNDAIYKFKTPSDVDDITWTKRKWTVKLKADDYMTLAGMICSDIGDWCYRHNNWRHTRGNMYGPSISELLGRPAFTEWLATGLKRGKQRLGSLLNGWGDWDLDVLMSFSNRLQYIMHPMATWAPVRRNTQKVSAVGDVPPLPQPPPRQ
jgi:hypothetical protein